MLLSLQSCESFLQRNFPSADEIASERIDTINWNRVDRFPLFESCDEMANKESQKDCFEITFSDHIMKAFEAENIVVKREINDTVILELKVDHEGIVSILNIEQSRLVQQEIPTLHDHFSTSLKKLPKIFPALKNAASKNTTQTVPVGMRFRLPVVIHVE
ncbi:hypothetical protein [Ascidiimonas sp. W6]|uniref:hypothetical protein n=1 Tax=Ascidiimonas meishanensis TaxID=3128903 RepID=UPI0030EBCE3B